MLSRSYQVVLEWDPREQLWASYVPSLNHLSSYGKTREDALNNTREAIIGYLEAAAKVGISKPQTAAQVELCELEVSLP